MLPALEKKDADRTAESERQGKVILAKERQLASREAELAEKEKTLELQKLQQEQQTEKRLREAEDRHREELEVKDKDIQLWKSKEQEVVQTIEDIKNVLHQE